LQVISIHRVLQHRARAVVAALVLALAALTLVACGGGGGGGGSSSDAQALIKAGFTNAKQIKSGKANLQLKVDVQGGSSSLKGPIQLGVTGPFQSLGSGALPKFDLTLKVAAQGQSFGAGLTSTSDNLFVQFGGNAYEAPANLVAQLKQSLKQSQQRSGAQPKLDLKSLNPQGWLTDTKDEGQQDVGGTQTDHVSAKLDVNALLDDVDKALAQVAKQVPSAAAGKIPTSLPANTRKEITDAVKSGTIDVWVGTSDKIVRKVSLALALAPKVANAPKSIDISLSFEVQDVNQPQTISAPANPKPLSELLGQFGGLLGGLGGAGGSGALGGALGAIPGAGGSGSGSGGSGSSSDNGQAPQAAQLQKYGQCLKDAGTDAGKAAACAQLLTK
jgi:hypothetical protein